MAIATVAAFHAPSPRRTAAAPADRVPPRVYSPYGTRRLARPMAVRADAARAEEASGRVRWTLFRGRRS